MIKYAILSEYTPDEEISVDESMVPFKGRLSFKQYMKDKPCKFEIKFWMLADATSAYCWNFDVHVGKYGTEINRTFGLSAHVVIDLLRGLENKGHCVFTDNFSYLRALLNNNSNMFMWHYKTKSSKISKGSCKIEFRSSKTSQRLFRLETV